MDPLLLAYLASIPVLVILSWRLAPAFWRIVSRYRAPMPKGRWMDSLEAVLTARLRTSLQTAEYDDQLAELISRCPEPFEDSILSTLNLGWTIENGVREELAKRRGGVPLAPASRPGDVEPTASGMRLVAPHLGRFGALAEAIRGIFAPVYLPGAAPRDAEAPVSVPPVSIPAPPPLPSEMVSVAPETVQVLASEPAPKSKVLVFRGGKYQSDTKRG